jgi:hypothetical protein
MKLFPALLLCICSSIASAQEVPNGVNYKFAKDDVNLAAKALLEGALINPDQYPKDLFNDSATCGPMLWKVLKPEADAVLLNAKMVTAFLSTPEPFKTDMPGLRTEQERRSFWTALVKKYPQLKAAKVRKANAEEIKYYWATIPFDIEEPFFTIDTGSERFIANFLKKDGKSILFWFDLVGDLRKLKN